VLKIHDKFDPAQLRLTVPWQKFVCRNLCLAGMSKRKSDARKDCPSANGVVAFARVKTAFAHRAESVLLNG
jgi:hypothetical protein